MCDGDGTFGKILTGPVAGNGRRKFAFVAHWVETWNVWLLLSGDLQRNPSHAWMWMPLWPLAFLASLIFIAGRRSFDVVDKFRTVSGTDGEIIVVRFFGYQFMMKQFKLHDRIRSRIVGSVLGAQARGADVIGLGALCKDERMTKGGEWIVKELGDQLRVPLIHGDTLTAAAVVQRARQLTQFYGLDSKPLVLTGSTSKIGRAIALEFVRRGVRVYMHTRNSERFRSIQAEAGPNGHLLKQISVFDEISEATGLWITGKANKGAGERLLKALPENAPVLNFAVPDPLTPKLLRRRPDVKHFDGGLIGFDPTKTNIHFNMRLKPGITYACHAGTMVHAAMGWTHHEVGPVQIDEMGVVWNAACQCQLGLPQLTSFLEPVSSLSLAPKHASSQAIAHSAEFASW